MWPFRAAQFAKDFDEMLGEMAEKQRIAEQSKQAAQDAQANQERLKAEEQAELESIGRRQTEIRCKDGTLITLRGVEMITSDHAGYVAARANRLWDPKSNIRRITIPIDNVLCTISTNGGDDAVPETSITFTRWKD